MIDHRFSSIGSPSWEVEKWVRQNSSLKGHDFLVALTVASLHNQRQGYAFPTTEKLVKEARVSESTVKRAIQRMRDSGEWIIVSGRGGPEGSRTSVQHRANRYYPTALLAGHTTTEEESSFQFSEKEADLAQAVRSAGINDHAHIQILREVWASIPVKYQADYVDQLSDPNYSKQFSRIIDKTIEVKEAGQSVAKVIAQRLNRSRSEPNVISSWLATWGIQVEGKARRARRDEAQTTEFMLHGAGKTEVDYGETGQEF